MGEALPTSALAIGPAGPGDDAALLALMRETPMAGSVSLAFAREPSFFHAARVEGRTTTIAAREPSGRAVAVFSRSVRSCWVAGEPRQLAYLSALRIAPEYRARRGLLRIGFSLVRELHEADPDVLPYAITTVVSDNAPAKRLLEAGLPGLPHYLPRDELVTLAAPCWRRRYRPVAGLEVRDAVEDDLGEIAGALGRFGRRHPFCPVWEAQILRDPEACRDLCTSDFVVALRGGRVVGCVALWDQSGFKQSVVCGYSGALAWTRRVVNAAAPILGVPRLPPPGTALRHGYLSHLAVDGDDPEVGRALVAFAADRALPGRDRRGLAYLTTALCERHPLLPELLRLLRPLQYRSRLYLVAWDPRRAAAAPRDVPHLEAAVL